jgi:hypothetical protein
MKGTSPFQVRRELEGLWSTATKCHDGGVKLFIDSPDFSEEETVAIVTPGIDLAKCVFPLHGVDAIGMSALVRLAVAKSAKTWRINGGGVGVALWCVEIKKRPYGLKRA